VNKSQYRIREGAQKPKTSLVEGEIQYLLSFEEQLLQAISTRALLPGILNHICTSLDCQIGNVISFISLTGDDAGDFGSEAALFGLYTFHSDGVFVQKGDVLGSLEMYCCTPRLPSPRQLELIERAKCLAAIAIKLDKEANRRSNHGSRGSIPLPGNVLEWPVSMS
jgi:hypothetical protein